MRVQVSPAGRMVRVASPSVMTAARIAAVSSNGLMSISRFLDFVEQTDDLELIPSKDLKAHLTKIADEFVAFRDRLSKIDALLPFQEEGVSFLWRNRGALLTDEQGLGKTIQGLCAIEPGRQALVICPAFMREVWYDECVKWRPDLSPFIVEGKLIRDVPEPNEVWIASYESLPVDVHKLATLYPGTVLIADEAQMLRNYTAIRTRTFRSLARIVKKSGYVWLFTGTPIINEPSDLWSLLQAAAITDVYNGRSEFERLWGAYRSVQGVCWGRPKPEAIERVRPHYLRRNRLEVLPQLPGKIYTDIRVPVKPSREEQRELAETLRLHEVDFERGDFEKLRSTNVSTSRRILSLLKLPTALSFVQRIDRPIVVFSCFRETTEAFRKLRGWKVINGEEQPSRRKAFVDELQRGELSGLACTIQTAGIGFTMTKSHDALFIDEAFTPAENDQAEDRLCRIGQNDVVQITKLVADHPIDRRVHQILKVKRELSAPMKWTNSHSSFPLERLRVFIDQMP